jgi:hypothetical protein
MNLPKTDALELPWFILTDEGEDPVTDSTELDVTICVSRPEFTLGAVEGLFEADWGTVEQAEHIVQLHNDWLEKKSAPRTEYLKGYAAGSADALDEVAKSLPAEWAEHMRDCAAKIREIGAKKP